MSHEHEMLATRAERAQFGSSNDQSPHVDFGSHDFTRSSDRTINVTADSMHFGSVAHEEQSVFSAVPELAKAQAGNGLSPNEILGDLIKSVAQNDNNAGAIIGNWVGDLAKGGSNQASATASLIGEVEAGGANSSAVIEGWLQQLFGDNNVGGQPASPAPELPQAAGAPAGASTPDSMPSPKPDVVPASSGDGTGNWGSQSVPDSGADIPGLRTDGDFSNPADHNVPTTDSAKLNTAMIMTTLNSEGTDKNMGFSCIGADVNSQAQAEPAIAAMMKAEGNSQTFSKDFLDAAAANILPLAEGYYNQGMKAEMQGISPHYPLDGGSRDPWIALNETVSDLQAKGIQPTISNVLPEWIQNFKQIGQSYSS